MMFTSPFGASVAGGVPVISGLQEGLAGDELFKLYGILNGTCNYILSQIETRGISFDVALSEAQKLGFAEADPTDDVDGYDARAKLAILARVGLRCDVHPTKIVARSISPIEAVDFDHAKQLQCTIRQVSWAQLQGRLVDGRSTTVAGWIHLSAGSRGGQPEPGDVALANLAVKPYLPGTVPADTRLRSPWCRTWLLSPVPDPACPLPWPRTPSSLRM